MAQTLYGSDVPAAPDNSDGVSYAMGTRFTPNVNGSATHGRWYFPANPPGDGVSSDPVRVGIYRNSDEVLLGATEFPLSATLNSWNQVAFTTPISLESGVEYTVVIWTYRRYVATGAYFANPRTVGDITMPATAGRFGESPLGLAYPNGSFNNGAYFADLVFVPAGSTTPFTRDYSSTWRITNAFAQDYSSSWRITNSFNRDYSSTWRVSNAFTRDYASSWGIRNAFTRDYASIWNVSGGFTRDYTSSWNIRNSFTADYSSAWKVSNAFVRDYASSWNILADTSFVRDYSSTWRIRNGFTRDYLSRWNIGDPVALPANVTAYLDAVLKAQLNPVTIEVRL